MTRRGELLIAPGSDSDRCSPQANTLLSIFPRGMFEFEQTREYDRYTFFRLIDFTHWH